MHDWNNYITTKEALFPAIAAADLIAGKKGSLVVI